VGSDPDLVTEYMRLAAIPPEGASEVEQFLRRKDSRADTFAVLERPGQPIALLQIHAGEATLFTFPPSQDGRAALHETYIGKIYDAAITQIHSVDDLVDGSAPKPARVEITGSRLAGVINLMAYSAEERAALMETLRSLVGR
jgi:hypothetical protein